MPCHIVPLYLPAGQRAVSLNRKGRCQAPYQFPRSRYFHGTLHARRSHESKIIYEDATKHDLTFLDTPMSDGGTDGSKPLTLMVGGTEDEFTKWQEALQCLGASLSNHGRPGTGSIAKLTRNLILGISMVAIAEGMATGERLGTDPQKLQQTMAASTTRRR